MDGTDSDYVIYLLFNTKKEDKLKDYVKEVKESYKDEKWVLLKAYSYQKFKNRTICIVKSG